jgi:acetylornithine deacetylase
MQALTYSNNPLKNALKAEAITLLRELIATPSVSGEESGTAEVLSAFFEARHIPISRHFNNLWVRNRFFKPGLPIILLNSHHDTVKPVAGYTRNPFDPAVEDGKLYGLGANDAGGGLVSLIAAFLHFYDARELPFNLVFCASAEEEISGKRGIRAVIGELGPVDCAIVGEPTKMEMGLAEKGLLVLDCVAPGKAGHAARGNGENAIYNAMDDIAWFRTFLFPRVSELLGPVRMSVTMISAGTQHNVVPDSCRFTVDIRTTDAYSNEELLSVIRQNTGCAITPRSMDLRPTSISAAHPLIRAGNQLGLKAFGSPTLSDKTFMPWPALKMGPGDTLRSHAADEFIYVHEVHEAIEIYINLLARTRFS